MGLILLGSSLIAAPDGVDVTNTESLAGAMHLFGPQHFVFPLLAHAVGTLAGATVGHVIAATHRDAIAWMIGALFLAGGVTAALTLPAPLWFVAADLVLAYFPMAWLAIRIGRATRRSPPAAAARDA